jgi:hypothetical protein
VAFLFFTSLLWLPISVSNPLILRTQKSSSNEGVKALIQPPEPIYTSRIIKASALITDTKLMLAKWDRDQSVADNLERNHPKVCIRHPYRTHRLCHPYQDLHRRLSRYA